MATNSIVLVINSPASTSVTFTPAQPSFTAPVKAGTVLGALSVSPAGWSGTVALSGTDAAKVSVDEVNGVVDLSAAVDLAAGTYNVTATTTP